MKPGYKPAEGRCFVRLRNRRVLPPVFAVAKRVRGALLKRRVVHARARPPTKVPRREAARTVGHRAQQIAACAGQQLHALPRAMLLSLLLPLGLNLLQLDDRGALELLGNDLSYLVMISFSSCEPCKFLTPHLIRLQANLNADGIPLMIATMDSETQPALGERHGIKDYPSLLLFVRGESVDNPHLFPGSTLQELVAWLREAGALATSRDALRAEVDARGEELPTGVVHPGQRMPELAELAMASRLQETSSPAAVRAAGTPLAVADEALLADCDGAPRALIGGQLGREQGVARWDGAQWAALGEGIGGRAVAARQRLVRLRGRRAAAPGARADRTASPSRASRRAAGAGRRWPGPCRRRRRRRRRQQQSSPPAAAPCSRSRSTARALRRRRLCARGRGRRRRRRRRYAARLRRRVGGRPLAGAGQASTRRRRRWRRRAPRRAVRRGPLWARGRRAGRGRRGGVGRRAPARATAGGDALTARPMELLLGAGLLYARDSDGGVLRHAGDGWEALPPLPRQVHVATGLARAEGRLVASGEACSTSTAPSAASPRGTARRGTSPSSSPRAPRSAAPSATASSARWCEARRRSRRGPLLAAALGATDGIAWLHDESRWGSSPSTASSSPSARRPRRACCRRAAAVAGGAPSGGAS